jgi:hypothetical protein
VATTSRHLKIQDPALSEQLDYYRARASEYDQWWLRQGRYDRGTIDNRRWFDDAGALEAQLAQFRPAGRVLEMASHLLPNAGATQLKRRLNDGREFRIYKIFHDPDALQSRMAGLGWNLQVAATERYFIHGHGSPCT